MLGLKEGGAKNAVVPMVVLVDLMVQGVKPGLGVRNRDGSLAKGGSAV